MDERYKICTAKTVNQSENENCLIRREREQEHNVKYIAITKIEFFCSCLINQ